MGSHEVARDLKFKKLLLAQISQNVAKYMPSLTSQLYGDFLLAVCLSRKDGAIYRHLDIPKCQAG